MTTQGTPGSFPGMTAGQTSGPAGAAPSVNPFGAGDALSITPPSPATDLSRIPAPGPRGVSAWIGRNERGEEVSGSGPIRSDPFSRPISGGSRKAASGPIRFRSATSGQAVRGNHDPKPFIWTKPVDQILI
jgi:hypothetical protein